MASEPLHLRVLGEIEVSRGADSIALPPSKKTRALLAYLAMNDRSHRRERLCELLWDIPDDPRGALRWSLSRIRGIVDEGELKRVVANRDSVTLERNGLEIDLIDIRRRFADGVETADLADLRAAADAFRGDFLEGLDLADYHDFQAWCVAEREESRVLQARILSSLVQQLSPEDSSILEYARAWVKADPFECEPRCKLVELLFGAGRRTEAEKQYEYGVHVLEEAGSPAIAGLHDLWKALNSGDHRPKPTAPSSKSVTASSEDTRAAEQSTAERPVVAVLPFVNMSDSAEDEFFADGLSEDIITALSASRLFPVIAQNSSFTFKGRNVQHETIAAELGARYILEGSVRRGGDRVRITAQLIDAENGHHLWAERFDRNLDDVFAVQDEITARIAAIVEPELSKVEFQRQSASPPKNFSTWELCVRGSAALHTGTREGNEEAKSFFKRAAEQDPTYSHAQAGLAYAYYRDLFLAVAEDDEATLESCRRHAERAIELDPLDAFAQGTLGLAFLRAGQFALAADQGRKAVEINPGRVASFALVGTALTGAGRPVDGIPYLERSLELNPIDPRNFIYMAFLAEAHFQAAEYTEAIDWARKSLQLRPAHIDARIILAASLGQAGKLPEAQTALDDCTELDPELAHNWRRRWAFRSQEDIAHISDGLRKAGLLEGTRDTQQRQIDTIVGRETELDGLTKALAQTRASGRQNVTLLSGEPGVGKSRVIQEFLEAARRSGAATIETLTYDGEGGRPYGPWIDALKRIPDEKIEPSLAADLAPLLSFVDSPLPIDHNRDTLFGAVAQLIIELAEQSDGLVIAFDDVQWLDIASSSLLHHTIRHCLRCSVMFVLSARKGELPDNAHLSRILARLRQEEYLDEVPLKPLSPSEVAELVRRTMPQVDGQRVFQESAGNPLLALEVARSLPGRKDDVPQSLAALLRDRVDRLPSDASKVIYWAAVVGPVSDGALLAQIADIDEEDLVLALEVLERHAFLRPERPDLPASRNRYAFAHDLVRRTIYLTLPEPRRRMLHLKVADALRELNGDAEEIAADIAYHASRGGEHAVAARACVTSGRRSLRLYASTDAFTMARRGINYARQLDGRERIELTLELMEISLEARRPEAADATIETIEKLVDDAVSIGSTAHARLGFQLISRIHWERGNLADAQDHSMRAARIARQGDDEQRVAAMSEAAYGLILLEQDLEQAAAMLAEAHEVAAGLKTSTTALPLASGMLSIHAGDYEAAAERLLEARNVARRGGDRYREFQAIEQQFVLAFQEGRLTAANEYADELVSIGNRLREGSEAPFAQAIQALAAYAEDVPLAHETLESALAELRNADAKQRLIYVLNRAAEIDCRNQMHTRAATRAEEALRYAKTMSAVSEAAIAEALLLRIAYIDGQNAHGQELARKLADSSMDRLAVAAQANVTAALAETGALLIDITTGGVEDGNRDC